MRIEFSNAQIRVLCIAAVRNGFQKKKKGGFLHVGTKENPDISTWDLQDKRDAVEFMLQATVKQLEAAS